MTRKDYIATAAAIKANNGSKALAEQMADTFQRDNPRFDRDRFMTACGL